MNIIPTLELLGKPLLRISMALVFLWFGVSQIVDPARWVIYIPEFVSFFGIPLEFIVLGNGIFEVVSAILLIMGVWVRPIAGLLGAHLLFIGISLGWTPTGIRDIGLALGTLSIACNGSDQWCLMGRK